MNQTLNTRNALLDHAKRTTTPPDCCDTGWVQDVFRESPGYRRPSASEIGKRVLRYTALLAFVVIAFSAAANVIAEGLARLVLWGMA